MIGLLLKLWHRFSGRSSTKTMAPPAPHVQPPPAGAPPWPSTGSPVQPLERNIEIRSVEGLLSELRCVDSRYRGADGEIIRCHEEQGGILLGCGHAVTLPEDSGKPQAHVREIAGLCAYCVREYQSLVEQGQIHPVQAERLSMVCSDCAQMTTAGHLCCPRHRTAIVGPDGMTQYIDMETGKNMARKSVTAKAFNTFMWLFGTSQEPESKNV